MNSRRLGVSLGINLLPVDYKFCSFNCIYCECGWTARGEKKKYLLPKRGAVRRKLEERLKELQENGPRPEAITFAGNGTATHTHASPETEDREEAVAGVAATEFSDVDFDELGTR